MGADVAARVRPGAPDLNSWLVATGVAADVCGVLRGVAQAGALLSAQIRLGPLTGITGAAGSVNVQGEVQKNLDLIADKLFTQQLLGVSQVAALVSEEVPMLIENRDAVPNADLVVAFDPLDGSSNIETNAGIGTIFSVLRLAGRAGPVTEGDILAVTGAQAAAGYILYGPATFLVLCAGGDVASFVLDDQGTFRLISDRVTIPQGANEFAINMAHRAFWPLELEAYVRDCLLGEAGPRGHAYTMRWAGSMVSDVHRIFVRGGLFAYPGLSKPESEAGRLRFLYEANPIGYLVARAGGLAVSDRAPLNDISAHCIHQRVPVALGSLEEVQALLNHYALD